MLKFTYTETGLYVERLDHSVEDLISRRILLAMRLGQSLIVEPGTATFLVPANSAHSRVLNEVEALTDCLSACHCDADYIEVGLRGTWIAQNFDRSEGIFLVELGEALLEELRDSPCAALNDRVETIVLKLWEASCVCSSRL